MGGIKMLSLHKRHFSFVKTIYFDVKFIANRVVEKPPNFMVKFGISSKFLCKKEKLVLKSQNYFKFISNC